MRIGLLIVALAALALECAGCSQSFGTGVALSISCDSSVSDAMIALVDHLLFTASGDETGTYAAPIVPPPFKRHEGVVYRPFPSTRMLGLAVEGLSADGEIVAQGQTKTFSVKATGTTFEGITLVAATSQPDMTIVMQNDLGDLGDEDHDGAADLAHADLTLPGLPGAPGEINIKTQTASSSTLAWTAPTVNPSSVAQYKVYRNGSYLATVPGSSTSYTDSNAPNTTSMTGPATTYTYSVSALDSSGNESEQQTEFYASLYGGGNWSWGQDDTYAGMSNFSDTAGRPPGEDIYVDITGSQGAWNVVAGGPLSPSNVLELGAFTKFTVDLKPNEANQTWAFINATIQRSQCQTQGGCGVDVRFDSSSTPMMGVWATHEVSLSSYGIGKSTLMGYVDTSDGVTLHVSNITAGLNPLPLGGWVTGGGLAAGTFISDTSNAAGGTYTIYPQQSTSVRGTSQTYMMQRTAIIGIQLQNAVGAYPRDWYIDNVKFR